MGPFVRYVGVYQANQAGFDNRDANILIAGLSLELGTRLVRPTPPPPVLECPPAPVAVAVAAAPLPIARPDRDGDGVPDDVDACPDVAGPASNNGCPIYEKLIVKPDRLELKEKIQFAWNTPLIDPIPHPLLDEVAKALQDNKGFRVMITGFASSEGGAEHNQALSEARARAVLDYIARRGISRTRLLSQGEGGTQPIESNATESGREANRRVEFSVYFIIVKKEKSAP